MPRSCKYWTASRIRQAIILTSICAEVVSLIFVSLVIKINDLLFEVLLGLRHNAREQVTATNEWHNLKDMTLFIMKLPSLYKTHTRTHAQTHKNTKLHKELN